MAPLLALWILCSLCCPLSQAQLNNDHCKKFSKLQPGVEDFTQSIYLHMAESNKDKNFVFSPLSLHSALAMLFMGTTGFSDTAEELEKVLGVTNSLRVLKLCYKNVIDEYKGQTNFLYGNNLWIQEGYQVNNTFKATVEDTMNAGVETIDFLGSDSVDKVNTWIRRKTGGKIKKMVKNFSRSTKLFMANALYFKEDWLNPFLDKDTSGKALEGTFVNRAGLVDRVPMMEQTDSRFGYTVIKSKNPSLRPDVEVITIPYENELFEMEIILPKDIDAMAAMETEMNLSKERDLTRDNDKFFNVFSESSRRRPNRFEDEVDDVQLKMPKFKIKTDMDVVKPLQNLGARKVFTPSAELDGLSDDPLSVNSIKHTAVVEVTKEGTEGAAVTGLEITLLSANFGIRKFVEVNRPFIFVVRDRLNNIPVLVGKVTDPTK